MSHIPTNIDIKTDLRRGIMASFSEDGFNDNNFKIFIENAYKNLELLKDRIDAQKYVEIYSVLKKSADQNSSIEKRREDLLTASCLI